MAARESYQNGAGPATKAVAVTKSDATVVDFASLYIGGAGDVAVEARNMSGTAANVTFKAVPAGTVLPIACTKVLSTGTSATDIVGLV